MATPNKPLKNITVLDFSRLLPGPFCSKILVDLGSSVIKIEDVGRGDYIHLFPPHIFDGESQMGVALNKGKKRMVLDFSSTEGRLVIQKLVEKADVLLESYRPGVMCKKGLGASQVHAWNPNLLYCSLTGFGQKSEKSGMAGHDLNFLAESGFLSFLFGGKTSETKVPQFQLADMVGGGLFSALQIVSALHSSQKELCLDMGMVPNLAYLTQSLGVEQNSSFLTGEMARYRLYETSDEKQVALAALEDKFWHKFCEVTEKEHLKDAGWDVQSNKQAVMELTKLFKERKQKEWGIMGKNYDICLSMVQEDFQGPENYMQEVSCDSQVENFSQIDVFGKKMKQSYKKAGEDTEMILSSLGYSVDQVEELRRQGVLG